MTLEMIAGHWVFVFVSCFSFKCYKVRQEMHKFNTEIPTLQLLSLTTVSAKSKIQFPRQGYLSPGNSIVLEIEVALLFISVTNSWAHLLKFKHAFNRPIYFHDLCKRCGSIALTDLHS